LPAFADLYAKHRAGGIHPASEDTRFSFFEAVEPNARFECANGFRTRGRESEGHFRDSRSVEEGEIGVIEPAPGRIKGRDAAIGEDEEPGGRAFGNFYGLDDGVCATRLVRKDDLPPARGACRVARAHRSTRQHAVERAGRGPVRGAGAACGDRPIAEGLDGARMLESPDLDETRAR
jgi:hypothetical protein